MELPQVYVRWEFLLPTVGTAQWIDTWRATSSFYFFVDVSEFAGICIFVYVVVVAVVVFPRTHNACFRYDTGLSHFPLYYNSTGNHTAVPRKIVTQ